MRDGETIIPRVGEHYLEGDMVYVIARQDAVHDVMELSGRTNIDVRNMMILGGSRIGIRIAMELQEEINIKLVDYNAEKAYRLAELLDKTLIINEDGRNTEAMLEEGLSNMDAFVAVTGRSETNILAAMLAKRMGVKKVIAEVENLNYINLAESIGIDTIINKKLVTASNIFRFTMSTDVQAIKVPDGQRCRGAGVHRQAERSGHEGADPGAGASRGCDHRRHCPRRQGPHCRRGHADYAPTTGWCSSPCPIRSARWVIISTDRYVVTQYASPNLVFRSAGGPLTASGAILLPRRSGCSGSWCRGRLTEFGDRYDLRHIRSVEQFQNRVETFDYETFRPFVERMMGGIRSVTFPGRVTLYARSSGTTSDRSKYIPVTRESLWRNHTQGMRDVATVYALGRPDTRAFGGKTLTLGGSCRMEGPNGRRPFGRFDS